ncbi:sensor histidine kinase [Jidongwangia harbinensis]|uniref:sensor histidine kinase n=1 Tax=Jidongwangia harbinensis TaxID=2878561 RepID=UPI001CD99B42|nr:HAMP domain-containing sensor histidine kinase [Jidongwangia harbinensis]MCA2219081.1 HAMP domain-containing histidine kinase [Jidongwangia harbinensis]
MDAPRVPVHRSLTFRLLVASLTIAVAAVLATSWIAAQFTSRTIEQQIGRSLSDDKRVYDDMLGYAATHRDWSGVRPLVIARASQLNRRITLMTADRQVIADSMTGPSLATARPSATVDPLWVDLGLTGRTDRIDTRLLGPFELPPAEQRRIRDQVTQSLACLRSYGTEGQVVVGPHGRPRLAITMLGKEPYSCLLIPDPTRTEKRLLAALRKLVAACAGERNPDRVRLAPDLTVTVPDPVTGLSIMDRTARAAGCLDQARRTQLEPYAAPPALLFVTDPAGPTARRVLPLSRDGVLRTGAATAGVLLLVGLLTITVGRRLTRPLSALTEAARRPDDRLRVPVGGRDEIGYLATALNDLAERRERSEHLRQAMVNDVAHELRNPLTNIRTWLSAVRDGLATVDEPLLTLLQNETAQLQHIVDDLRDLAAADAGTLRMHPEALFLGDAVGQVVDAHRPNAAAARVRLITEHAGDPEVIADPVRLRQLIGNLLANAIRHTPPGGTVTVRTAMAAGSLTIAVADTGVGIAPGDLPKVFDRFWRADGSRSRSTGGSGLGLPIARQIAEAHGGTITVGSTPDTGTTFTVVLPHRPVDEYAERQEHLAGS